MKKKITLILLFISAISFSQKINFSLKGGVNVSNTKFSVINNGYTSDRDFDNRISFYLGGGIEFPVKKEKMHLQLELLYSRDGYTVVYSSRQTFGLDLIKIPLSLKVSLFDKLHLLGGGYVGYVINVKFADNAFKALEGDGYENFDYGIILGFEYQFNFGAFIEARYNYGIADISSVAYPASFIEHIYKNRIFQIGMGYRF